MLPVGDGITLCRRIKWGAAFSADIIYISNVDHWFGHLQKQVMCNKRDFTDLAYILYLKEWWMAEKLHSWISKWIFYALNPYCSLTKYLSRCAENVHGLRSLLQHSKLISTGSLAPLRRPLDAVPIQLMALWTSLFPFRSDSLYMQPALSS
jgi:hypothetical protein